MRRIMCFFMVVLFFSMNAVAQKGLFVQSIFSGKYNKEDNAVVTLLKGSELKEYGLTYFHSVTVVDSKKDVSLFEYGVLADSDNATKIEMVKQRGKVLACYFQLAPREDDSKRLNRFILFRKLSDSSATVIYMEGATDLKSLIQLFVTKK